MENLTFRVALKSDIQPALDAIWRIFNECGAAGYTVEGKLSFKNFIQYNSVLDRYYNGDIKLFVCLDGSEIVGALMLRRPSHICLLFVDKLYHRRGIARNLFEMARLTCIKSNDKLRRITVNSSPDALGFYHRLGFKKSNKQQTKDGITYTPMQFKIRRRIPVRITEKWMG